MTFQNSETGIIKAGRFTVQTGPVAIINVNDTCLSHAERDVAYVEPPSLTRHLAAHNRHRTLSHSQTLRGHCREQGSCRNLASSWAKNSQAIIHTTSLLSFTHLHSLTDQHAAQVSIVFCTAGIYLMVRVLIPTNNSLSVIKCLSRIYIIQYCKHMDVLLERTPPCMALYCTGVTCSKPGGGTSQYFFTLAFFFSRCGDQL